ncbi:MAG: hypothetical protein AAB531_05665 [Patescibacteria group bacterium]
MKKVKKTKITGKRNFLSPAIKIVWTVAFIGLVVLGVLFVRRQSPAIDNAITLATTVKPETFTELYFENHLSLPGKIILYQDYPFKFTIHNLENKDMSYPYEVYINLNGEKQIIDEASVFVKSGAYKTIDEGFTITYFTKRVEVIVNLKDKNQKIDFWIEGM